MGLRDWFRRRPRPARDPLRAFDERIDALASRSGALRKSAAALMSVRNDLQRRAAEIAGRVSSISTRIHQGGTADSKALAVLQNDLSDAVARQREVADQADQANREAETLAGAVKEVESELTRLRTERDAARMSLASSSAVLESSVAFQNPIDQMLQLDAARDEIERAHALAEIYREEAAAGASDDLSPARRGPKSR